MEWIIKYLFFPCLQISALNMSLIVLKSPLLCWIGPPTMSWRSVKHRALWPSLSSCQQEFKSTESDLRWPLAILNGYHISTCFQSCLTERNIERGHSMGFSRVTKVAFICPSTLYKISFCHMMVRDSTWPNTMRTRSTIECHWCLFPLFFFHGSYIDGNRLELTSYLFLLLSDWLDFVGQTAQLLPLWQNLHLGKSKLGILGKLSFSSWLKIS